MATRTQRGAGYAVTGRPTYGVYEDIDTGVDFSAADTVDVRAGGTKVIAATASGIQLPDSVSIRYGDGPDVSTQWNGTYLQSGPESGLWAGCPSMNDPDPYKAVVLFDDFLTGVATGTQWITVDDGGTGTNAYADVRGGSINIVTAAADNDYHAMRSTSQCFNLVDAKALWFEARFKLTEAATNESAWWFGLTDTTTTGGFQANTAGPLASYDGVMVWKDEASLSILSETSNAGTQATNTTMGTFVSGNWTRVGFFVSAAATTAVVTFYTDLTDSGTMTAFGTTKNLTRAGLEEMHAIFGVKAGPSGNAETLQVDYVKCVQLR